MSRSWLLSRDQARLLLPLGGAMALSLAGDSTLYAVLPNQLEVVGINLAVVGLLLGANRLIRIPGNVLAGVLNDRLGRRRLFLLGLSLGILATLVYSMATGFWPLLGGRLLWGIAWALINVGGYTMVVHSSTDHDRGMMTGFYQMAFMLGLTVSPLIGGALTDTLGFRAALRACAAVSFVGLAIAVFALPETNQAGERPRGSRLRPAPQLWLQRCFSLLRQTDRQILLAGGLYMLILFANSGVLMSTVSLYLRQRWGSSISVGRFAVGVALLSGVVLALRSALGMLVGPVAGIWSDRLPSRWPVVRSGLGLGICGFLVLTLPGGVWVAVLGVVLISAGTSALVAGLAALVGDAAARDHPGRTMGSLATAGDIGSATGPLVAYALISAADLRWTYIGCAVALGFGLAATWRGSACRSGETP